MYYSVMPITRWFLPGLSSERFLEDAPQAGFVAVVEGAPSIDLDRQPGKQDDGQQHQHA